MPEIPRRRVYRRGPQLAWDRAGPAVRDNGSVTHRAEPGRSALRSGSWTEVFARLSGQETLEQDDLERLAVAAYLLGETQASELAWERAHRVSASRRDADRAARCAFWLG